MDNLVRRYRAVRVAIVAIVLVGVPTLLGYPAFSSETPIVEGQASPRTVIAPGTQRVSDEEATERARREAADAVRPIVVFDPEAQTAVVSQVRDWFARVRDVRKPAAQADRPGDPSPANPSPPSKEEQVAALEGRLPLDTQALTVLVNLGDAPLDEVAGQTVDIAQQLARQRIRPEELGQVVLQGLQTELAVRDMPADVEEQVVGPMIREAMQATVTIDEAETESARSAARENVAEVVQVFPGGAAVITAGEVATANQVEALRRLGLAGSNPRWEFLRALGLTVIGLAVVATFLRTYRDRIWRSNRRLLLLVALMYGFTAVLSLAAALLVREPVWLYAWPVGALAMLVTILLGGSVGALVAVPVTLVVAFLAPETPGLIAFTAAASLLSVPFVTRLSARGDLRRATLLAGSGYVLLAGTSAAVFGDLGDVPLAVFAGVGHAALSAVIVLGGLPFVESWFGIVTATSLIDLADRNHPLLRELEQRALGSYNHSIVVSTLVERACRAVGADALLGSVAALYHDIGKVQRPYFFVENQFGVPNPHEDLEPEVSAVIIHEHVTDGIRMARRYHLPPEVVDGIATHHGTTLVTFFYLEAVRRAGPGQQVDQEVFRYKGRRPATRETAVLMLADCCEAASRAAAQNDRNLTRDQLEKLVEALFADRVDDGQLDESTLTFQDLAAAKASFIDTLVGVYHPRITYPEREPVDPDTASIRAEATAAG
ncbi:MAG: HD family phosphohydrolase [Nitriliruptorales bacterium]